MEVVLFQPQIPHNAGNVARTCAVTGSKYTLVRPLGFSVASRHLKRAGLDYWDALDVNIIENLEERLEKEKRPFYFLSSKASQLYTEIPFTEDAILIFGSETAGLDPLFFQRWPERFFTIPMVSDQRCLNLSNAVAVVVYEGWRQLNFKTQNPS